ncbi:uncharacterized protein LOC141726738 [Zonotrichia albicollis]|uniref:uncharacterized protein LOC141726738 n=1 Tax=Zonotrichia albicollis TaxID=44394 RepID=UPI003D80B4B6
MEELQGTFGAAQGGERGGAPRSAWRCSEMEEEEGGEELEELQGSEALLRFGNQGFRSMGAAGGAPQGGESGGAPRSRGSAELAPSHGGAPRSAWRCLEMEEGGEELEELQTSEVPGRFGNQGFCSMAAAGGAPQGAQSRGAPRSRERGEGSKPQRSSKERLEPHKEGRVEELQGVPGGARRRRRRRVVRSWRSSKAQRRCGGLEIKDFALWVWLVELHGEGRAEELQGAEGVQSWPRATEELQGAPGGARRWRRRRAARSWRSSKPRRCGGGLEIKDFALWVRLVELHRERRASPEPRRSSKEPVELHRERRAEELQGARGAPGGAESGGAPRNTRSCSGMLEEGSEELEVCK